MTATPATTAPRPDLDDEPTDLRRPTDPLADLRSELHDALEGAGDRDPDELASHTPRGAALLGLAARVRRAVRALGAPAGVPLTDGPGIVVVRDAATTASLLDAALDPRFLRRLG